ncbi:MAG: hypothetical protein QOF71_929 [Candidatus Eremiobacteraeota bacterium]|jgi:hypothetical protein|nr:hypothetical protein [Candidatus Eremiobacteraeota bacterium]
MANFIIRLVCYALLFGVAAYLFQTWWSGDGLDAVGALRSFHDKTILGLRVAPLALALIGAGRLRSVAVFAAFLLAGAALTAPFVCARLAGV